MVKRGSDSEFIRTTLDEDIVSEDTVISNTTDWNRVDSTVIITELKGSAESNRFLGEETNFNSDPLFSHTYVLAIWVSDF